MKVLYALLALCWLATACDRQNASLPQRVAGTWHQGPHQLTLAPDGRYTSVFPGRPPVTYTAQWRIERDCLVITEVKSNAVPIAADTTVRIVSVDKHRLEMALGTNHISMVR